MIVWVLQKPKRWCVVKQPRQWPWQACLFKRTLRVVGGYRPTCITDHHIWVTDLWYGESSLFDPFQPCEVFCAAVRPLTLQTEVEGIDIIPAHMSLATLDRVMGNRSGKGLILKRALWRWKKITLRVWSTVRQFWCDDGECIGSEHRIFDSGTDWVSGDEGARAYDSYTNHHAEISQNTV